MELHIQQRLGPRPGLTGIPNPAIKFGIRALGALPRESAPLKEFEKHYLSLFERIGRPVSTDEAGLLLGSFGEDESFGLAWSLLHLIENAPENAVADPPTETANE